MLKIVIYTTMLLFFISCGKGLITSSDNNGGGSGSGNCVPNTIGTLKIWATDEVSNGILGGIGGIVGADAMCANLNDANHPGDCSTYKAFIVDSVNRIACTTANCTVPEGTDWVLAPNTDYFQADGVTPIFTTNGAGIFVFGTMDNQWVAPGNFFNMWTGLENNWTIKNSVGVDHCTNWSIDGGGNGAVGRNDLVNQGAMSAGGFGCATTLQILCVEQ